MVDCRGLTRIKGYENYRRTLDDSAKNINKFIRENLTENNRYKPNQIVLLHPHLCKSTEDGRALKDLSEVTFYLCDKFNDLAKKEGYKSFGINDELFDEETGTAQERLLEDRERDRWHLSRIRTEESGTHDFIDWLWIKKLKYHLL